MRPAGGDDVDGDKPNVARMYDYFLGGSHNFAADREAAERAAAALPRIRPLLRHNRAFLGRCVRVLLAEGVDQFLDLGSGIPTVGNVHQVAQALNPAARVAYVDIDAVAVAHSRHLLGANPHATAVQADLRDPTGVLADPAITGLLDFGRPVAVLLVSVLHFVPDADDPAGIVAAYRDRLAPGSHLAISHAWLEDLPPEAGDVGTFSKVYAQTGTPLTYRTRDQITALFDGTTLLPPGVVPVPTWRPGNPLSPGADIHGYGLAGVSRR
ncbi:MAG: SAM-dependent methyltransferase [Mycobacteriales bacterium]